jgi:hypothetical protein
VEVGEDVVDGDCDGAKSSENDGGDETSSEEAAMKEASDESHSSANSRL